MIQSAYTANAKTAQHNGQSVRLKSVSDRSQFVIRVVLLVKIQYQSESFILNVDKLDETSIAGTLQLDSNKRTLLNQLLDDETDWYLDDDGERLEPELLFAASLRRCVAASLWSAFDSGHELNLLCRFLDLGTGQVWFNTRDGYPGELFKWVRTQP